MSENTITPITINAPSLEQADYGENIKQQFLNIDNNFKSIVGNEYLKGDRGANIYIKSLSLLESGVLQDKFKALFNSDILDLKIGSINSAILYMLYAQDENNDVTAVSSLPYTFLDPRFNPPPTDPVEMAALNETEDKSCIVMYDESIGGFTTVNSFPTIYYNQSGVTTTGEANGVGSFCWKINNVETDLPAQGPKGDRGADGFVYFMMLDTEKMKKMDVPEGIYIVKFYQDLYPNVTEEFDYSTLDGHMGIVWHDNDWYMSPLCYDDVYGLIYSKNENANIRNILATQSFREIMLQSHPDNNLCSLFLPKDYPAESIRGKTPSHIITTAKFEDEDYFEKNDNPKILVLAPGDVHRTGSGRTLSIPDKEHKFIIGYNNVKIGDKIETKVDSDGQYKTDIKTQLNVEGPTHITGATLIDGDARINGDASITENATIVGATRIGGGLNVTGDTTIAGDTSINQSLNVAENTTIDGDIKLGGNLKVDEDATIKNATVLQNLIVGNKIVTDEICYHSFNKEANIPFIYHSYEELIKAKFPAGNINVPNLVEMYASGATITLQITISNKHTILSNGMSHITTFKRTMGSEGSEEELFDIIFGAFKNSFDNLITAGKNKYGEGREEFNWVRGEDVITAGSNSKYIFFWYNGNEYDTELIVELKSQSYSQKTTYWASEHKEDTVLQLIGLHTAIKGNARITGDTLIEGTVSIGDDVLIGKNASISGNATIDGKLTVKDLTVEGTMDLSNSFETVSTKNLQMIPSGGQKVLNINTTYSTMGSNFETKTTKFAWNDSAGATNKSITNIYEFDGDIRADLDYRDSVGQYQTSLKEIIKDLSFRIEELEKQLNK